MHTSEYLAVDVAGSGSVVLWFEGGFWLWVVIRPDVGVGGDGAIFDGRSGIDGIYEAITTLEPVMGVWDT